MLLTDQQKEVLVGSLLGDGRLECRSKCGTARFRVHHAESQRELVIWKYKIFRNLTHGAPWSTNWLDKRVDRCYRSWFFHTLTTDSFTPILRRFYSNGIKIIPAEKLSEIVRPYVIESLQTKIVPVSTESESSRVQPQC
jgi:hypothetical protein